MPPRPLLCLALAATLASPLAQAGAREKMVAFTSGLKGLDGRFEQQVFGGDGPAQTSSGTVKLSAPRQFRWEYLKPAPQLIVADGNQVWIYDPDLEQVTVRNQSAEEQGSPLAVLIDPTELDRQYKVSEGGVLRRAGVAGAGAEEARRRRLQQRAAGLRPDRPCAHGDEGFARPAHRDRLRPWQRNPRFAPATFRFTPPKGTDVVGTPVKPAQVTPLHD
jgi:outer membrane lipoprotein carrier protein